MDSQRALSGDRMISKLRQEASLKRVSAAVEKSGNSSAASRQQQPPPRTAMAKLFASRTDQSVTRAPSNIFDSDYYTRRSEPAIVTTADQPATMDKQQEMEATEMRFRRSLPAPVATRSTQDLAYALQSAIQTDASSCTSSSGSSSSSSASASSAVAYLPRSSVGGPPLSTVAEHGRPLERARSADVVVRSDPPVDDMTRLRQQVTLLMRTLEEEKKRRAMEQKLMQQKILELQGLIRHNMPEQKRELERSLQATTTTTAVATPSTSALRTLRANKQIQKAQERSPYKTMKLLSELGPDSDNSQHTDEETEQEQGDGANNQDEQGNEDTRTAATRRNEVNMGQQLTKLRAQMRALVQEAQQEAQTLKKCLDDERRMYERKERQLRMEASLRATSLEERYAYAKKKLLAKTSLLSTQVATLTEQNEQLEREVQEKNQRIQQLELAVGGRRIVEDAKQKS